MRTASPPSHGCVVRCVMVWPWPIRKRAIPEGDVVRADRAPTVHETPTREFAAHIPADAYSVHEKPTREIEVQGEPSCELDEAGDAAAADGLLTRPASDPVDSNAETVPPRASAASTVAKR